MNIADLNRANTPTKDAKPFTEAKYFVLAQRWYSKPPIRPLKNGRNCFARSMRTAACSRLTSLTSTSSIKDFRRTRTTNRRRGRQNSPHSAKDQCRAPNRKCVACWSVQPRLPAPVDSQNKSISRYDAVIQSNSPRDSRRIRLRSASAQAGSGLGDGRPDHHPRVGPTHEAHGPPL